MEAAYTYMHNGTIAQNENLVSIRDVGILRGYGLFDYFKVISGVPVFVEDHLDRLFMSCAGLCIPIPYTRLEVLSMIHEIIALHPIDTFAIRIVVTAGVGLDSSTAGNPNVYCIGEPIHLPNDADRSKGIRLTKMEYTRYLYQYKSVNYISLMAHKHLLDEANAADFLYTHHGFVSESTRSNIFFIDQNDTVVTSNEYILEGVTRLRLLKLLNQNNIATEIRPIEVSELTNFKAAFITGSSKNIMPVRSIDTTEYKDNALLDSIIELFNQHSMSYIDMYNRNNIK